MEFLESVGLLVIVIVVLAIAVYFTIGADHFVQDNGELIKCSDKCQQLIDKFNRESRSGTRTMTKSQLNRRLRQILNDPIELQKANEKLTKKKDYEARRKLNIRNSRKIGFKYDLDIFEIFATRRFLSEKELIALIKTQLTVDDNEAKIIFNIWRDIDLISCNYNMLDAWEVGRVLTEDCYKLDPCDITRKDWLREKGLELDSK